MLLVGLLAVPAHGGTLQCIPPKPPWWRYLPSLQARSDGRIMATISLTEIMSVSEKWEAHMDGIISMAARLHSLHLAMVQEEQRVELGLDSPTRLLEMRQEAAEILYKLKSRVEIEPDKSLRAYMRCLLTQFDEKFSQSRGQGEEAGHVSH